MNNLEFLTGEKFKDQPIPGSKSYFFNNRMEKNKYESNLTDEEVLNLKKYLPIKFDRFNTNKNPDQVLHDLGWNYDESIGKFYNQKYQNNDNSNILFDCAVKTHNRLISGVLVGEKECQNTLNIENVEQNVNKCIPNKCYFKS